MSQINVSSNHSETQFAFSTCLGPSSCFLSEDSPFSLGEVRNDPSSLQGREGALGFSWGTVTIVVGVTTATCQAQLYSKCRIYV